MIIGCDPGAFGAFALLDQAGALVAVRDMPIVEVGGRKRVAAPGILGLLGEWAQATHGVIELVGAMPKQGVSSSFAFGYAAGLVEGVMAGRGLAVSLISPRRWKAAMGLTADKGACRLAAQRMWPTDARLFARVKDDGRAEAALLAVHYLMRGAVTT